MQSSKNIIEVYESNFIEEIKHLSGYLDDYPFIGMDTEFPGLIYPCSSYSKGFYYKYIKTNVDKLKLIQFGVTLFNEKGETPPEGGSWQFNLRFNYEKDPHSSNSISLLSRCGIDFSKLQTKGILHSTFSEYLIISGLVLNDQVNWISFNGLSDFAYLLRLVMNCDLPDTEEQFISILKIYFPNYFDIKILVNGADNLKGGLNKIAKQLGIERIGDIHQAGSDSVITGKVFFKILKTSLISSNQVLKRKNILFGVGLGRDDNETLQYTYFSDEAKKDSNTYANYEQSAYGNNMINMGGGNIFPQANYQNQFSNFEQNQKQNYPYTMLMAYGN